MMIQHGHASVSHHDQNSCTNKSPTNSRPLTPAATPHLQTILHCQTIKNEAIVTSPPSSNSHGAQQPVKPWLRHLHPPMTHCPCGHGALHLTSTPIFCNVIQHFYHLYAPISFLPFPSLPGSHSSRQRLVHNNNWRMPRLGGNPPPWRRQKLCLHMSKT